MRLPSKPPSVAVLLANLDPSTLVRAVEAGRQVSDYPSWDKVRRRPAPDGLTPEHWWVGIKFSRATEPLSLRDKEGRPFVVATPPDVNRALYEISIATAGRLGTGEKVLGDAQRDRYLMSSLREEAISSSLLEGAATTRRQAAEMLRTRRRPRTRGERMVANNFAAMQWIREHTHDPITPEAILRLHAIVTEGTLDNQADEGRIQQPGEDRVVVGGEDDTIAHDPPPAVQLPERLEHLCQFANSADANTGWLHPLARAIITHFMMGYDHYFVDGNGRTARALFYWVALREGHWLMEYLSISSLLYAAPAKYAKAYLDTETDDGDVTYFLAHQLDVIRRALEALQSYLDERQTELREATTWARRLGLNHRQVALVQRAIADPNTVFTAQSHASSHAITLQTARTDLNHLEEHRILEHFQRGRRIEWAPTADLTARLTHES